MNCGLVCESMAMVQDEEMLESTQPQVRVGTPGILKQLGDEMAMSLAEATRQDAGGAWRSLKSSVAGGRR